MLSPLFQRTVIGLILLNAVTLGLETSDTVMASWGGLLHALDRALRRLLGLEAKTRQYIDGSAFVRTVIDRVGLDGSIDGASGVSSTGPAAANWPTMLTGWRSDARKASRSTSSCSRSPCARPSGISEISLIRRASISDGRMGTRFPSAVLRTSRSGESSMARPVRTCPSVKETR